jgi:hypothetical protein
MFPLADDSSAGLLSWLIDNKFSHAVSSLNGTFGTTLQAAAFRGHYGVVQQLLIYDVEPNVQSGFFGTALQAASFQGNSFIVRLLLEAGSDVLAECGAFGSPMEAARTRKQYRVLWLLSINVVLQRMARAQRKPVMRLEWKKWTDPEGFELQIKTS